MASACNPGCNDHPRSHNEESPKVLPKNILDADLLDEPYALAVHQMGYDPQDILHAIKNLQKRQQLLKAEKVLQELMRMESEGRIGTSAAFASASVPRKCLKRSASASGQRHQHQHQHHDDLGSDGEEDPKSMEEDGGRGGGGASTTMMDEAAGGAAAEPKEPPTKKAIIISDGKKAKDEGDMRRRVLALREENRRLKARHLCRKCRKQPVSLTFLPCGHFSFCQECGQSFQTCPLCCKTILADVRTFLG